MNSKIRKIAESLGYEITNWDIEQIKDKYFWLLVNNYIEQAIVKYFGD